MDGEGTLDTVLGVQERNPTAEFYIPCGRGPYSYVNRKLTDKCAALQYWSLHSGGANFVFCDGSVHFITYGSDTVLYSLATRAGVETLTEY
jgi:prepilin-type processing-associated H-X9-DG protein